MKKGRWSVPAARGSGVRRSRCRLERTPCPGPAAAGVIKARKARETARGGGGRQGLTGMGARALRGGGAGAPEGVGGGRGAHGRTLARGRTPVKTEPIIVFPRKEDACPSPPGPGSAAAKDRSRPKAGPSARPAFPGPAQSRHRPARADAANRPAAWTLRARAPVQTGHTVAHCPARGAPHGAKGPRPARPGRLDRGPAPCYSLSALRPSGPGAKSREGSCRSSASAP